MNEEEQQRILEKWKEKHKDLAKKLDEIKPVIYNDPLIQEINHGNGLITLLEPKVIDYNHAALVWIRPFYNNVRQSFYFDEMLIIDDRMSKEMVKKIVERFGNRAIEKMLNENSYMVECFASYKSYYTRYFITDDELNLRLIEITF